MRLTSFTDYSLRVLIYLAAAGDRRSTIADIASSFGISQTHLTKVAHVLGRKGFLATARGKGGGIALAMPPKDIVVGDVVRAMEGEFAPAECFGTGICAIARICRLRGALAEAVDAFNAVLDRYTLHDLMSDDLELAQIVFKDRPLASRFIGVSS